MITTHTITFSAGASKGPTDLSGQLSVRAQSAAAEALRQMNLTEPRQFIVIRMTLAVEIDSTEEQLNTQTS